LEIAYRPVFGRALMSVKPGTVVAAQRGGGRHSILPMTEARVTGGRFLLARLPLVPRPDRPRLANHSIV
jgi:hypothetical protein